MSELDPHSHAVASLDVTLANKAHYHRTAPFETMPYGSYLPTCSYEPAYIPRRRIARYEGVRLVHYTRTPYFPKKKIFPNYGVQGVISPGEYNFLIVGVLQALNRAAAALEQRFELVRVLNVEAKDDYGENTPLRGRRWFLEMDLKMANRTNAEDTRLSEYYYTSLNGDICLPDGFAWDPHAHVYIVIPVKNQANWVKHLADDLADIYAVTMDPHFSLILVDFSSDDGNVEEILRQSPLKPEMWTLVKLSGRFQRAGGLHAGIEQIREPNSIVFMCDLHLEIPPGLIDSVRKHTIRGRQIFTPVLVRLGQGNTPESPGGFWETAGYGLMSMYQSDYYRIGGMNTREFKYNWGGEDWEMVDRILAKGYEIERQMIPDFYHFHHRRDNMWKA